MIVFSFGELLFFSYRSLSTRSLDQFPTRSLDHNSFFLSIPSTEFLLIMVLLQFSWRRGSKDSRGQGFKGLFSKDFISAFNILSLSSILKKIDTTDLLISEVRQYLSSFGDFAVILYISKQSLYDFCHTFNSL